MSATCEALIAHHCGGNRLRLKVPSQRGNAAFFAAVKKQLAAFKDFQRLETNPGTGSILLVDKDLDIPGLAAYAKKQRLFALQNQQVPTVHVAQKVMDPIERVNGWIQRSTHGDLDLSATLFLSLLTFGMIEIVRGNLKTPPWYTAFWYAFGILTKSVIDHGDAGTTT